MTKPTQSILALVASLACGSAFAAGKLQQWEMTTRNIGASGPMGEQKMIVCRKPDETSSARPPAPANCKYSGTGSATSHGAFVMECSGEHPYTIKGEGKQTATTMEGTMDIIMEGAEIKSAYSGKLLGSCEVEGVKNVASGGMPGAGGSPMPDRSSLMQQDGSPPPYAREGQRERAQAYAQGQSQAAEKAAPPAEAPPAAEEKPESNAEKAKKKLKSLLPF